MENTNSYLIFYDGCNPYRFFRGYMDAPAIAAKLPTSPPTKAVIKISKIDEPPNGNSCPIFCDKMLPFFTSIQNATMPHNRKIPIKPERKLLPKDWRINRATRKATIAILHQGRNNPATKLTTAVNMTDNTNFIVCY
jgi:hypothetical protein